MTVTHGLAHRNYVRNKLVGLVAPEIFPRTPESWLNLVGNEQPTGRANQFCCFIQIAGWRRDDA